MTNKIHGLPPKMAQQFAAEAREGKNWKHLGQEVYETVRGNIKICLVNLDPPMGHQYKISEDAARQWRSENS